MKSLDPPTDPKEFFLFEFHFEFPLNLPDEFIPVGLNFILGCEEGFAFGVSLGFQIPDYSLACEFFLQSQSHHGCPAGPLDLPVQFLDFPFQTKLGLSGMFYVLSGSFKH
jgi:hypothetical protein